MASDRIGELLVRENLISTDQLRQAQVDQRSTGKRLAYSLTKLGILAEQELTDFLSKQYGVPSISLDEFEIDPEVLALVPKDVAIKHVLIPVQKAANTLIVAMADPANIFAVDDIKFMTGYNVEPVVASPISSLPSGVGAGQATRPMVSRLIGNASALNFIMVGTHTLRSACHSEPSVSRCMIVLTRRVGSTKTRRESASNYVSASE